MDNLLQVTWSLTHPMTGLGCVQASGRSRPGTLVRSVESSRVLALTVFGNAGNSGLSWMGMGSCTASTPDPGHSPESSYLRLALSGRTVTGCLLGRRGLSSDGGLWMNRRPVPGSEVAAVLETWRPGGWVPPAGPGRVDSRGLL